MSASALSAGKYRQIAFWAGCAAVSAGVLLHMPMYGESLKGGHHMSDMPIGLDMIFGMVLIAVGVAAACYGALPERHRSLAEGHSPMRYEAPDETPLGRAHYLTLLVLVVGLVIDTMKPATLGFVSGRTDYVTAFIVPAICYAILAAFAVAASKAVVRHRGDNPTATVH